MKKAYLNWSSGKDAAFALHKTLAENEYSVEKLVTSINTDFDRISMHGVRRDLLEAQAKQLGLPLQLIALQGDVSLEKYTAIMRENTEQLVQEGFDTAIFGDILLEDLMEYRKQQLQEVGLTGVFPLWQKNTTKLAKELIATGYKAIVVCVNARLLDESFCGRLYDQSFLNDLPEEVDPCGENGEFHTFVYDGPLFKQPIAVEYGEKICRDYAPTKQEDDQDCFDKPRSWDTKFWFQDLKLKD